MSAYPKISLMWLCKTPRGWLRFPAVMNDKRREAKHGFVMEQGQLVEYPEGRWQTRSRENGKQVYKDLLTPNGKPAPNGGVAYSMWESEQRKVKTIVAQGGTLRKLHTIKTAGAAYVKYLQSKPAPVAAGQASLVVEEFERVCSSPLVKAVTPACIAAYRAALRKRKMSDRTIVNKDRRLRSFLRFAKVDVDAIMPSKDRPKHIKKLPHIYRRSQIDTIRAAADEYMGMVIDLGLMLGLREQEIMFSAFSDVDFERSVFSVTSKPDLGFIVKDKEDRQVPIPRVLLARIRERHDAAPDRKFIVGTKQNTPNSHLLRTLKRLAKKTGLNCGHCKGCLSELNECREWTLHSLRRTYLTNMLRGGVDLSTVQAFAGHADLDSTMRYLRPAESEDMQDAVNAIWGSVAGGQIGKQSSVKQGRTRRTDPGKGKAPRKRSQTV